MTLMDINLDDHSTTNTHPQHGREYIQRTKHSNPRGYKIPQVEIQSPRHQARENKINAILKWTLIWTIAQLQTPIHFMDVNAFKQHNITIHEDNLECTCALKKN